MKGQLVYVKGHPGSEVQAAVAMKSLRHCGYDVEPVAGMTASTLDDIHTVWLCEEWQ